jgi:hypothetical protein
MSRFFCIGDIHGDYAKLLTLMTILEQQASFVAGHDELVQLGDKNDRGPDTFQVMEWFRTAKQLHPGRVHCILGNHEMMMLKAARAHIDGDSRGLVEAFWYPNNGGPTTLKSYMDITGLVSTPNYGGAAGFENMLVKTGHMDFLLNQHELLMETDEYIFCHAPQKRYMPKDFNWRTNVEALTWTNGPHNEGWVERNLNGKIAVHGHIHGLSYKGQGKYNVKKVRRHGNTFLADTGCGCADVAPLSCLVLPDLTVYNSDGEIYSLKGLEGLPPEASLG